MRRLTLFHRQPHGVAFVKLPDYFKVDISIENKMLLLTFIDGKNSETFFISFSLIDDEEHRDFDDFSKKGQELLLERLSKVIVADISSYVSGEYEGDKEPELPYHTVGGCFDIDSYMDNWLCYYDLISDDDDILDEYEYDIRKGKGK